MGVSDIYTLWIVTSIAILDINLTLFAFFLMPYRPHKIVVPTPIPAPSTPALKDAGTPTNLSWNYPPGKFSWLRLGSHSHFSLT
jgi:hypothetical protein